MHNMLIKTNIDILTFENHHEWNSKLFNFIDAKFCRSWKLTLDKIKHNVLLKNQFFPILTQFHVISYNLLNIIWIDVSKSFLGEKIFNYKIEK